MGLRLPHPLPCSEGLVYSRCSPNVHFPSVLPQPPGCNVAKTPGPQQSKAATQNPPQPTLGGGGNWDPVAPKPSTAGDRDVAGGAAGARGQPHWSSGSCRASSSRGGRVSPAWLVGLRPALVMLRPLSLMSGHYPVVDGPLSPRGTTAGGQGAQCLPGAPGAFLVWRGLGCSKLPTTAPQGFLGHTTLSGPEPRGRCHLHSVWS